MHYRRDGELQGAGVQISISGLILCGLIVGALGVINDITVTQAASVWELSAADPKPSPYPRGPTA